MSEQGRPEQEHQPRADQPNASERSPPSGDGTSPDYLSSAPTLSTDSFANKRSRKRASSKGSSGRSRKRSARKILGLVSEDAKREDKSARKEDSSKKDLLSTDSAARNASATSLLVRDLPPTDLSAKGLSGADMTTKEQSANNLSEKNLPAQSLSAKELSTTASMAVVQDVLTKETFSEHVLTKDTTTKDTAKKNLTTKESSAKNGPASDPFAKDVSAGRISANDMSERACGYSNNGKQGNAASNVPQGQPHLTPDQHHLPAMLYFTSPSCTSPRDSTSPLVAAVGTGSNSSPEANPLDDQLVASVLKGGGLPLHPSQLPVSPMLEREPPRKNRRVSLDLRPIVEFISPLQRSSLSDSATDPHPPGQEPSSFGGKLAPAGSTESGRRAAEGGRSPDVLSEEKRVQVYRPVLKVRQPAVVEQQRAPLVQLDAIQDFDECPLPDTLPGGALNLSAEQPHWSYFDDVGVGLSRDPSPWMHASCIRQPGQPQRRGSRVSLKDPLSSCRNTLNRRRRLRRWTSLCLLLRVSMQCPVRPPSSAIDPSSVDVEGHCTKGALVLVSCVCLLVLCSLCVLVVQQMLHTPYVSLPAVCATEDCVTHARHILRTLDATADPCLSFHSYVCGAGSGDVASDDGHATTAPSAGVASNYAREAGDTLLRQIDPARRLARVYARQIVPLNLLSGNGNSSTASKTRAALELCLTGRVERRPAASLPFFMRQRGLTWPTPFRGPITLIRVLSMLLDLSVKWNAALWFDVRVRYLERRANVEGPIIVMGEPGHVPLLRMEQVGGLDEPAYESTVRALARYLSKSDTEDPFKGVASLKQLKRDEKALREAILFALTGGDDIGDRFVPLRDSGSAVFEGVSPSDWTSLLVEYLGGSDVKGYGVNITLDTTILVLNRRLFAELSRLTVEIPAARLLDVVGWMFAYSYTWIENRLFDLVPPSVTDDTAESEPDPTTRILCYAVVLESFGIAPVAPLFSRMFPSQERAKLSAVLNATAHSLVETVRSSRGVSNATKNRAGTKITAHTFQVLWPPQPFLNPDLLDTLYSPYPSAEPSTFFESWLKSRRAQRAWLVRHHYGTLMTLTLRWYIEEILYVYSLNHIVLGLAAVFPPSYHRQGSQTMTYAGIGFQFARKLVSCIDSHGRFHDYDGASTGSTWWEREDSSAECRLDRTRSAHEATAIADLFALNVALAAMKRVSDASPPRLKLLEKLTATQTFYVSYCSRYCGDPDAREKCDLAMNGSEFQAAFDCQWWMFDRGCLFV